MEQRTVLVVEDERTIAESVAAWLRAEGFAVHIAGSGPAAVEAAHRTRPDLVILDIMLPGFDGLEVCRRIQAERPVGAGREVTFHAAATPPELRGYGDRERLHQVLANLLDNAARHSPPGGAVTLTARRHGDGVMVEVTDGGPGIPADERVRVFDRFSRGGRAGGDGGTGLGLAIARWVVELHGGSIAVVDPGPGPLAAAAGRAGGAHPPAMPGCRIRVMLPVTRSCAP
jgi:signal transduction histidine kinase